MSHEYRSRLLVTAQTFTLQPLSARKVQGLSRNTSSNRKLACQAAILPRSHYCNLPGQWKLTPLSTKSPTLLAAPLVFLLHVFGTWPIGGQSRAFPNGFPEICGLQGLRALGKRPKTDFKPKEVFRSWSFLSRKDIDMAITQQQHPPPKKKKRVPWKAGGA